MSKTSSPFIEAAMRYAMHARSEYLPRRAAPIALLVFVLILAGCRAIRGIAERRETMTPTPIATVPQILLPTETNLPAYATTLTPSSIATVSAPPTLVPSTPLPVVPTATRLPVPSTGEFPAQRRLDTSQLVVYQVWLNYYAQNPANGQTSPSVFANAQAHLPELAQMGVTMLQLSPFQPFGQETTIGSPYGILDYEDVNPGYAGFSAANPGTKAARIQALKDYVAEAHRLSLRVIMDCVFHSTAPQNTLVTSNPNFFKHSASGTIARNRYGFDELDYSNPDVRSYMINMVKYWVSTVDVDGCRADVAVDVPLSFWAMLNNEMKKIKPSWFMVAETSSQIPAYAGTYSGPGYDPGEMYTNVYGFDALYGVRYMGALRGILVRKFPANVLPEAWLLPQAPRVEAPPGTIFYRAVDNHDQRPRAVELGAGNNGMIAAMAVNFTLDGIPFVFNGQEIGDTAPTSIQVQRYISWNNPPALEDRTLFGKMIALRRAQPALNQGTTVWYTSSQPDAVVAFLRQAGNDRVLVVVNFSPSAWNGTVMGTSDHPLTGKLTDLMTNQAVPTQPTNNRVKLSLGSYSYLIASLQ